MRKILVLALIPLAASCARRDVNPVDSTTAASAQSACAPGGKLVVTDDSVGHFAIATATMGEVAGSCTAVDTVYESMCCYMALLVHLKQPGVLIQAEQDEKPDESHQQIVPAAAVRTFEVSGDSVVLRDGRRANVSISDLVRRFGPGYVDNPNYDDNDGPQLHLCAFHNLSFRVSVSPSTVGKTWLADTSKQNDSVLVTGVLAMERSAAGQAYCRRMRDSLAK